MTIHESTELQIKGIVDAATASQLGSASNDTLAAIAWEAFVDACDGFDVPSYASTFAELFPVYAELV